MAPIHHSCCAGLQARRTTLTRALLRGCLVVLWTPACPAWRRCVRPATSPSWTALLVCSRLWELPQRRHSRWGVVDLMHKDLMHKGVLGLMQ